MEVVGKEIFVSTQQMMMTEVKIRPALLTEAGILSDLTWRSKGYWGYDEEFLRDCGELLNIKQSYLASTVAFVAEEADKIIGFYGFSPESDTEKKLMYLQIEPDHIGRGLGRLLWDHAVNEARARAWLKFFIHTDPNAEDFFIHMGATPFSDRPSRFRANRRIPILEYRL